MDTTATSLLELYLGLITTIASPVSYFGVVVILRLLPKRKQEAIDLQVILVVTLALNYLLKITFHAPRPFVIDESISNRFTENTKGYSFPSGHSQLIASFCSYYILRYKNLLSWILGALMIISVAISRVYFGLHFIRDVLVGVILGIGVTYFYLKFRKKEDK